MQWMSAGTVEGCSECDSDTSFPGGRELNLITFPAGAPTVVVIYLIVSPCGPLRLHSPPVRHANIILHFSPPTVTFCSHESSKAKNLLSTTFFALSYPLVSFSHIVFPHFYLILFFLILPSSFFSISLATSFLLHPISRRNLSLVSILIRLLAVSATKGGQICRTGKTFTNFPNYPTDFVFHYDSCLMGNRDFFPGLQRSVRETEKAIYFRNKK
jgi:hypothetical protein